jgi:dienelactone hydrolase
MKLNNVVNRGRLILAMAAIVLGSAGAMAQAGCGPYPGCLYEPPVSYGVALTTSTVTYTDVAGLQRDVAIAIRRPTSKPGALPVVIWVHGGGEGHSNPVTSMNEWSTVTAQAGYLSVAGAHEQRVGPSRDRLCQALGVSPADCPQFQPLHWDRPKDVSAIITELVRMNTQPGPWNGKIDVNRIAVGGHSAGSAASLTLAGARWLLAGSLWNLTDPRPIAFLGFSPQGPGHIGFFDTGFQQPHTSWDLIDRPVLIATGDGDAKCDNSSRDSCEETPMLRRIAFERLQPGDKYMTYIKDVETFHNLFALKTSECHEKNVSQAECSTFAAWLQSSALAFLDFYMEGLPPARMWLENPFLSRASRGVADIERN